MIFLYHIHKCRYWNIEKYLIETFVFYDWRMFYAFLYCYYTLLHIWDITTTILCCIYHSLNEASFYGQVIPYCNIVRPTKTGFVPWLRFCLIVSLKVHDTTAQLLCIVWFGCNKMRKLVISLIYYNFTVSACFYWIPNNRQKKIETLVGA